MDILSLSWRLSSSIFLTNSISPPLTKSSVGVPLFDERGRFRFLVRFSTSSVGPKNGGLHMQKDLEWGSTKNNLSNSFELSCCAITKTFSCNLFLVTFSCALKMKMIKWSPVESNILTILCCPHQFPKQTFSSCYLVSLQANNKCMTIHIQYQRPRLGAQFCNVSINLRSTANNLVAKATLAAILSVAAPHPSANLSVCSTCNSSSLFTRATLTYRHPKYSYLESNRTDSVSLKSILTLPEKS